MLDSLNIEAEMSYLWRLFYDWLHRKLWNDNFRCSQWRPFRQDFQISVSMQCYQNRLQDWFNTKMSSYQYRKSHCGDKTVVRSSYLHNGIFYTGKMASLFWFAPQIASGQARLDSIGRVRSYNNRHQVCYGRFGTVTSLRPCLACDLVRL